jgi:hypothetical protein
MEWIEVKNKKKPKVKYTNKVYESQEDKSHKKILCNNVLGCGTCGYGNKCLYAHSLREQIMETNRRQAYNIIKNKITITDSMNKDKKIIDTFICLSKTCYDCENNKCPGGYNCKYGAIEKKYTICYNDLMYGRCNHNNCNYVHLTKQGLKPIIPSPKKYEDIYTLNMVNIENPEISEQEEIKQNIPQANLLNGEYFINILHNDSDSDSESDIKMANDIKDVIYNSMIDLCERSIFD